MILSSRSKHGLCAMIQLAIHYGKGHLQMKVIAEAGGISQKYVEQIVPKLIAAGLVRGRRGPKGGHVLAVHPSEIKLSRIISALEWSTEPIECGKHRKFSKGCNECATNLVWAKLRKITWDFLDSTTLQDLVDMEK